MRRYRETGALIDNLTYRYPAVGVSNRLSSLDAECRCRQIRVLSQHRSAIRGHLPRNTPVGS